MRKIFASRLWVFCICLLVAVAALVGVQLTYAEGGGGGWSGPGTTPTGNSDCENKTFSSATGNRCGGTAWVLKPVDAAHAQCTAIGATHYYKLGWLMYTGPGTNPNYTGNIGRSAVKTSAVVNGGGSIPYRPGIAVDGVTWEKAESDYQIAKNYIPPSNPSWPELGEFCWNPDWGCTEDCDPPPPPSDTEDTIYGEGNFWADSYITVTNEVATHTADVSTKEGSAHQEVTIKVSTDTSATVTFRHTMSYDRKLWDPTAYTAPRSGHSTSSSDDFEELKTKLKIQQYGVSNSSIKDEDFGTGKSGDKSGQDVSTTTVSVSPNPGETLTVCQVLTHTSVKYIVEGKDKDNTSTPAGSTTPVTTHSKWEFKKYDEDNQTGYTILCAEVYRPEDPTGDDPPIWTKSKQDTKGGNNGDPVFAGETSNIGWDTHAEWEEARRVNGWRAIAFVVPSNINYNRSNVTGDLGSHSASDPCSFYSKASYIWCSTIGGREAMGDLGAPGSHDYDQAQTIALQDYVGYKYCTSFGYFWKYWYSISYDGQDSWQEEGKTYWTNFDASCRTIAKKPSAAFWNSGVLTNGGIKTSLSPRILGVGDAQTASSNQFDYLYGSWSEYLAVIGKSTATFGSGASLSRGSSSSIGSYNDIYPRSPMTLSNTNSSSLGNSGVRTSETLRTRLDTYLKNSAGLSSISSLPNTITSGTHIINVPSGGLNINRNIVVSGGSYASIYQIPQVVIFVNGNVNISGSVTEIDAWIIATGEINTCSDFVSGSTQTKSLQNNTNTVCDQRLTINGPVMASSAKLNRSFGSDPVAYGSSSARYTPGEVFNLSGENYLWAYAQAGRYSSSYTEAYSRELAPRY